MEKRNFFTIIDNYFNRALSQMEYLSLVDRKLDEELEKIQENEYYHFILGHQKIHILLWPFLEFKKKFEAGDDDQDELSEIRDLMKKDFGIDVYEFFIDRNFDIDIIFQDLVQKIMPNYPDLELSLRLIQDEPGNETGATSIEFKNYEARKKFEETQRRLLSLYRQRRTLYETSLIDSTNSFEYYISNLLEIMIRKNPESLMHSKKEIYLKDIFQYETLDDFKETQIEQYVRSIMFKNRFEWFAELEDRNKSFKKNHGKENREKLNNIFLIRNAIVHNGGKITEECECLFPKLSKDAELPLSKTLVEKKSLTLLEEGLKIGYYILMNYQDKRDFTLDFFDQEVGLGLIKNGNYQLASNIYAMLWEDIGMGNQDFKLRLAINYSLSLKLQGKTFDNILKNVDTSVILPEHKLAISALRGNVEEILFNFKKTVDNSKYTYNQLVTWPVLKDLINTDEFVSFSKENFPKDSKFYFPDEEDDKNYSYEGEKLW